MPRGLEVRPNEQRRRDSRRAWQRSRPSSSLGSVPIIRPRAMPKTLESSAPASVEQAGERQDTNALPGEMPSAQTGCVIVVRLSRVN